MYKVMVINADIDRVILTYTEHNLNINDKIKKLKLQYSNIDIEIDNDGDLIAWVRNK